MLFKITEETEESPLLVNWDDPTPEEIAAALKSAPHCDYHCVDCAAIGECGCKYCLEFEERTGRLSARIAELEAIVASEKQSS